MLSRITNTHLDEYELVSPGEVHGMDAGTHTALTKPTASSLSRNSDFEYQSLRLHPASTTHLHDAYNMRRNLNFQSPQSKTNYSRSLFQFVRRNTLLQVALAVGIAGSLATFGFALWLSQQIFYCPTWTVHCDVKHSVQWFTSRLGFVQGFLSSIYGISIASIAYATYQLAETTIWPMLTEQPLTLEAIDRYLAHARGSLPSFPLAAWHSRKSVSSVSQFS